MIQTPLNSTFWVAMSTAKMFHDHYAKLVQKKQEDIEAAQVDPGSFQNS